MASQHSALFISTMFVSLVLCTLNGCKCQNKLLFKHAGIAFCLVIFREHKTPANIFTNTLLHYVYLQLLELLQLGDSLYCPTNEPAVAGLG